MPAVISDNSPLSYLVQIKCQHCLPALYEQVLVPEAVLRELEHPRTPAEVRDWLQQLPTWIVLRQVHLSADLQLAKLDAGESNAIQLAIDENAGLLLMDERAGVAVARARGLNVTGTLGVLLQASQRGLVDLDSTLLALQNTTFRFRPGLVEDIRLRARGYRNPHE